MTHKLRSALLAIAALPCLLAAQWQPAPSTISTRFASQVTPANALPEYPRPQMVRRDWTNLNGLWDYAITPKEAGRPERFEGSILVPFAVESSLSGVKRPLTPDQRLWYRRFFDFPDLKGRRLLLHFGAVDWQTQVFVNGTSVGEHQGGYDPFTFDITGALKPGASHQEIVVSVWDPTDAGLQPRGKQVLKPSGIFYTAVSGIWQTVWLEPVAPVYVTSLSMTPDVDGSRLRITVHSSRGARFTAKATLRGKNVGLISGRTGAETAIPLQSLDLWSPENPTLYDLEIKLQSGDSVTGYFGMRKIELRADASGIDRLFLNNHPRFMLGPLDQGWWPDGLYTPPTDEAIQFDLQTLKKLGFNMLRKHVKVEPARYYYWCDKLGLLVWQDMPSAMLGKGGTGVRKGSPEDIEFPAADAANFQRELEAMLANLGNAPSIVVWVPFNEGWGQHATNEILRMVKSLDPSRLVDGPSGWEDRGFGDIKDMHAYPGPSMFPVVAGRASVLGEFGGLGRPVQDHLWWTDKRNWGYRTFSDAEALESAYEDLIAKLAPLVKAGLSAAIYTQTTDVEGEVNGLMTYDRKVLKFDAAKLAQLHQALTSTGSARAGSQASHQ